MWGERGDPGSLQGAEGAETPGAGVLTGFSRRVVATTQMQAPDARKAFPCFDEPAMKANFTVTLIHPSDHEALSNMPVDSEWGRGSPVPGRAGRRADPRPSAPCRHPAGADRWRELEHHQVPHHSQDVHLPAGLHRQPVYLRVQQLGAGAGKLGMGALHPGQSPGSA